MDFPQETPWGLLAGLSLLTNIAQAVLNWRKGSAEADKTHADVEQVRQELVIELIDKNRELRDEMVAQNERYVAQIKAERDAAIAGNKRRDEKLDRLEKVVELLEKNIRELGARLEEEQHLRRSLQDELEYWRRDGPSGG